MTTCRNSGKPLSPNLKLNTRQALRGDGLAAFLGDLSSRHSRSVQHTTAHPGTMSSAWHDVSIEGSYYDLYGTAGFVAYLKRRGVELYRDKVIASRQDCEYGASLGLPDWYLIGFATSFLTSRRQTPTSLGIPSRTTDKSISGSLNIVGSLLTNADVSESWMSVCVSSKQRDVIANARFRRPSQSSCPETQPRRRPRSKMSSHQLKRSPRSLPSRRQWTLASLSCSFPDIDAQMARRSSTGLPRRPSTKHFMGLTGSGFS